MTAPRQGVRRPIASALTTQASAPANAVGDGPAGGSSLRSDPAIPDAPLDDELVRLAARIIDEVTAMSPDVEGVSRPAYGAIETRVMDYLAGVAREYGLTTWNDPGANLVIAAPRDDSGAGRYGLIGSHVDSVPQGGRFDGLAGVVAGLLTLIAWQREGSTPRLPVRLLVLRGEESAWFGHAYMGSRALLGRLGETALAAKRRGTEETLTAAMAQVGIPVDRVARGEPLIDASAIAFFLEAHIEQGPLLVARDWPVAAVTAIRGNIRYPELQCVGEAGHSGTVPRWLRHDAVFATAELITRMDEHWATIQEHGGDLVLTVGILHTDPQRNAMSRIPGEVTLSLEVRSQDMPTLNAIDALVRSECHVIERERGVRFHFGEPIMVEPAALDQPIIDAIKQACLAEGLPAEAVPSGAGHDAAVFAQAGVPTGLLFIRNRHGSHNPREDMELPDLMAAASVLRRVALELAG